MIEIPNRISLDKTATALYRAKVPDAAQILPRSSAPNPTSGAVWCAEVLPQREPSLRSNSLAANLLVPLLHIHEIRILIDLLLRVPELFLELELVVLDVLLELGDLLVVALLPLRVLLQLLHLFELLLAELLLRLLLLLLRGEAQRLCRRCDIHLARIASSEQVVILALLRRGLLGRLVARGNRLLPHENTLCIHEVRILLQFSNLPGLRVARLLVLLPRKRVDLALQKFHLPHRLSDDSLRSRRIHSHGCVVKTESGRRAL